MRHSSLPIVISLLAALGLFLPGINWGLPSRAVDPFLFGDQPVWTGEKIRSLVPTDSAARGADVDANPIARGAEPVQLNADDRQRAEIILRYRLYSYQPDEMITFRSLAHIKDFRGDPRLYQYGGLWIYPVGALLKIADVVGLVELRGDQAFYLNQPEQFGRFYVVARAYTMFWGLVATAAVFWFVRRLTGSLIIAAAGAICFAAMPVVVNMAHEAKPHLPGLALTLLAVIAAAKYVDGGRTKWSILAGVFCGAAFGMVLSGLLAFAILPMMAFLRPGPARERWMKLIAAGGVGVMTYVVSNPFVAINAIFNRGVLRSNLGNSTDMYRISFGGVGNAFRLIAEGASPVVLIGGVIGLAVLIAARRRRRRDGCIEECPGRGDVGWLLLAPAGLVLLQFILLADGKPAEYARFALLPNTFLVVAAFAGIALLHGSRPRATLAIGLTMLTVGFGAPYVLAFVRDSRTVTSRLVAAERIRELSRTTGVSDIILTAEPAPYSAPPVDLFRNRLILAPKDALLASEAAKSISILVTIDPALAPAPVSWADVRFVIENVHPRSTGATTVSSH
ncbi:MAG: hypothetical protein QOF78_1041 [Phycisphaerales bacterium]|nr:hypothetical protein [Phycisphaerales bacterium]